VRHHGSALRFSVSAIWYFIVAATLKILARLHHFHDALLGKRSLSSISRRHLVAQDGIADAAGRVTTARAPRHEIRTGILSSANLTCVRSCCSRRFATLHPLQAPTGFAGTLTLSKNTGRNATCTEQIDRPHSMPGDSCL